MQFNNNNYYVWEFSDLDLDNQAPPKIENSKLIEEIGFKFGESIQVNIPTINFVVSPKKILEDYQFNITGIPLFSSKLRQALLEIGIDYIEYFKANLITKKGRIISDDYKIANIVCNVECFDWNNSKYDDSYQEYGLVSHVDYLVIDKSKIQGELLFRMEEAPRILLVGEELKKHLESKKITGIRFTPLNEYKV